MNAEYLEHDDQEEGCYDLEKKGDLEDVKLENLNKKSVEQVGGKQRQKCWHRSVPVAVSRGPGGGGGGGHGDRGGGGSGDGDTGGDGAGGFV